jgi:predicted nuclease of predicted toxin-antitoxin system
LSLRLLVDEDTQAKILVTMLRNDSHNVLTVNEATLAGCSDSVVLDYARQNDRVVLTQNCDDFEALHENDPNHPGILVIYKNDDYSKDLSFKAIVRSIANLEAAGISPINQFIALNQWHY